jgi:hypothetical protein
LAAEVIQHTDMRMIQARDGLGFAFESLFSNGILRSSLEHATTRGVYLKPSNEGLEGFCCDHKLGWRTA